MSLNDPNWGRRPGGNQGPPDLEELWRNFNRKLEGLFGRRGADGGTGGGSRGPRRMGGIGLLAGLVFAVWLASGFYIVP
ncbi:MAG: protease modulator HflK, partial [Burkholderiales bacterium]